MDKTDVALKDARRHFEDKIERLATTETDRFMRRFAREDMVSTVALQSAASKCQARLLDNILSEQFAEELRATGTVEEVDRQLLAYDLRAVAKPLVIPRVEPVLEVRRCAWVLAACLGAVAGIYLMTPLTRLLLGYREVGLLVGGPAGASACVFAVAYLAKRKRMIRVLQWVFGGVITTEVVSMWLAHRNPLRLVRRSLLGRAARGETIRWFKRLALYIAGIFMLQLAIPVEKLHAEQLRQYASEAVLSWLRHHVDLFILLAWKLSAGAAAGSKRVAEPMPSELVRALAKLVVAGQAGRAQYEPIVTAAHEVIQEFENAGYELRSGCGHECFTEPLHEAYDVVGLINVGDPFRVLEEPVRQGGRIVLKGRLTKRRE